MLQKYYKSSIHIKTLFTEQKQCECNSSIKAALYSALSFLRIVTQDGRVLKIFTPT